MDKTDATTADAPRRCRKCPTVVCACHPDATHSHYRGVVRSVFAGHSHSLVGVPIARCTHDGCDKTATWSDVPVFVGRR
jgi:hypothetical protein